MENQKTSRQENLEGVAAELNDFEHEDDIDDSTDYSFEGEISSEEEAAPNDSENWYAFNAFRENFEQNVNERHEQLNIQPQNQEEDETDFLEMDFDEPDNSEIENEREAKLNGHANNIQPEALVLRQLTNIYDPSHASNEVISDEQDFAKNTGAKPKKFSLLSSRRSLKNQNPISDGDHVFKITGQFYEKNASLLEINDVDHLVNFGASSSTLKLNKSPSKSSQNSHKKLHEQQNDFLFEIEPIKPRNSVTVYTSNCDEKILIEALSSLKLEPNREIISNYFNANRKPSIEMNLVDYIIYRSKLNCNYTKLIELIEKSCKREDEEYGSRTLDINFYPLDFFSTSPELINIEVTEIVQRWNPKTDLSPLVNIKNKYFYQTNVLGKIVNIIRKINQKAIFRDNETVKIPQFFVSGYITITSRQKNT